QVMMAIRVTIDPTHCQHIAHIDNPYEAFQGLEKCHGVNSGIAMANIISKIVNHRYDSLVKLEDHISTTQALHNQ
ncbi:hypothetical protein CROQUDRAFT_17361, partial [Cronartium quercuum f. sp. fusiforme G11]